MAAHGSAIADAHQHREPQAQILDFISRHGVASRNTADAFIKEMLKYGYARLLPQAEDKRTRPLEPTEASLDALHGWVGIHLATLDGLDHGQRLETFLGTLGALAVPCSRGLLTGCFPRIACAIRSGPSRCSPG